MRLLGFLFHSLATFLLAFLRPPWGGILFLTPVLLIGLGFLISQGLEHLETQYYVQDLQDVEPEKMPAVIEKIAAQEVKGIPVLVEGLFSEKMSVAIACREALEKQIKTWKGHSRTEAAILFDNLLSEFVEKSQNANTFQRESIYDLCRIVQAEMLPLALPGQLEIGMKSRYLITQWEQTLPQPMVENTLPTYHYSVAAKQDDLAGEPLETTVFQEETTSQLAGAQVKIAGGSPFLNETLLNISRKQIETLPTQDLMRLLNHPIWEIGQIAEEILLDRDGFSQEHVVLATSLYHPEEHVRISLLRQLTRSRDLELSTWLTELLQDPNANVRYETAHAICRGNFPIRDLQPLFNIIYADNEPRIAQLVAPVEKTAGESRPVR